jgi:hypothetical protein
MASHRGQKTRPCEQLWRARAGPVAAVGGLCHRGTEMQIGLAVDGGVANAQLSRGDDGEGRCFGVRSSDFGNAHAPCVIRQ